MILTVLALVLAGGGVAAYHRWDAALNARVAAAQSDLAQAASTLATSERAGRAVLDASAGKVADDAVRQTLAALLDQNLADAEPEKQTRQKRIASYNDLASATNALAGKVDKATAAVKEAQAAWELAQAQAGYDQAVAALAAAIDAGNATLAGSEGKVADNAVRQTLTDAIGAATALRNGSVDASVNALTAATAAVNASAGELAAATSATSEAQSAWQAEQDRIAAEQAAAAQQAAAAKKAAAHSGSTSTKTGASGGTGSHTQAPRLGSSSGSHPVLGDPGTTCTTPSCGITF